MRPTRAGQNAGLRPAALPFKTFKVVYDELRLPVHMSSTYTQADNVVLTVENGNYPQRAD